VSDEAVGGGPASPSDEWRGVLRAVTVQGRVFFAVFLRESAMRRGQAYGLGWLLGALEPLLMLGALTLLFTVTNHTAGYGTNMILFLATGIFPLYMFLYTSIRVRSPATLLSGWRFPLEMPLDEILAHFVLQVIATTIVGVAFLTVLLIYGVHDAMPFDVPTLLGSSATLFLFGLGVGIINVAIARIFPFWAILWSGMVRLLYHFSGLYYVIDYFSPKARSYFSANPITHGVNWFRHAFYPYYPTTSSSAGYVLFCALASLFLGLCLERLLRREHLRGERIY
jgi:capsular polysaccharide transport system permease protein